MRIAISSALSVATGRRRSGRGMRSSNAGLTTMRCSRCNQAMNCEMGTRRCTCVATASGVRRLPVRKGLLLRGRGRRDRDARGGGAQPFGLFGSVWNYEEVDISDASTDALEELYQRSRDRLARQLFSLTGRLARLV